MAIKRFRITASIAAAIFFFSIGHINAQAKEETSIEIAEKNSVGIQGEENPIYEEKASEAASSQEDDPQSGRASGYPSKGFYDEYEDGNEAHDNGPVYYGDDQGNYSIANGSLTGLSYIHNSRYNNSEILHGIDVSQHQSTINWDAVKNSGIDFVILRAGYRGYGSSGSYNADIRFKENIQAAKARGIDVGAYFFSQAISQEEAVAEAEYFLGLVKGYEFELPLVMDFEYASNSSGNTGRLYEANLSRDEATAVVDTFCDTIEANGYTAMIYANRYMLENKLQANELQEEYPIWLANYTTKTGYQGEYDYWQYAETGRIAGVKGNVDSNFRYLSSPEKVKNLKSSVKNSTTAEIRWDKVPGAYGYEIYRKDPGKNSYSKLAEVIGAASTSFVDDSLSSGGEFSYKVRAYYNLSSGNNYGSFSEEAMVTLNHAPVQVKGLTVGKSTINSLSFSWNKVSGATGYEIYSYDLSKEDYTKIATIKNPDTLSYTHKGLPSGTAYKYKIRAYKTVGGKNYYGKFSSAITMATRATKVTGLKFSSATKNSVTLTWKKQTGGTGYRVYRYDEETGKYITLATFNGASKNSYTDKGLEVGTKYKYKVRAYKKGGDYYYGEPSDEYAVYTTTSKGIISATSLNIRKGAGTNHAVVTSASRYQEAAILSKVRNSKGELWYQIKFSKGGKSYTGYVLDTYFKLRPDKVQEVKVQESTTSSATINWRVMEGATGYVVYRYDTSVKEYKKIATLKGKGKTSYTDKTLSAGQGYKYKVRGYSNIVNKNYYGSYSDVVSVATKPSKVSGLKMSAAGASAVKLTWKKISSATGYQVYRYNSVSKKYERIVTLSGADKNTYTDKGLKPATTYKYKVRAYKKYGNTAYGSYSSELTAATKSATATVTANVLNVRSGASTSHSVVTSVSKGQKVTVVGSAVNSAGETWYKVKFTKDGKGYSGYVIERYLKMS
ncbi:GH25 family lysozyme [Alloiococcus sp. CFN-8]|uniref:GH25 family lysozyme n=1 Tax=Alloiococcus sp. CFN-8 TaxID=3416081 RepID=UPI003CE8506B